jgi:hypothetical protein
VEGDAYVSAEEPVNDLDGGAAVAAGVGSGGTGSGVLGLEADFAEVEVDE